MRAGRDVPVPERSKGARPDFPRRPVTPAALVTLEFVISPEGRVTNLRVAGSATNRARDRGPQCGSGSGSSCRPFLNDQPIPVAMRVTLNFSAERRAGGGSVARRDQADIQEPKKIKDAMPDVSARSAGRSARAGMVILEAVINPLGRVTDLRVVRGVSEALDKAAIAAVRQWEFTADARGRHSGGRRHDRDGRFQRQIGGAAQLGFCGRVPPPPTRPLEVRLG